MKILAISITIAGILLSVEALDCKSCIDTRVRSDSASMTYLLRTMLKSFRNCHTAELVSCGRLFDACATTTLSVDMQFGSVKVTTEMDQKSCSTRRTDRAAECEGLKKMLGPFIQGDLTCRYKNCYTDGCN